MTDQNDNPPIRTHRPPVIGWDVGGAHVKACLLEGGRIAGLAQWVTPLWTGLEHLDQAIRAAQALWPQLAGARHAVTMTAEMTDLFPDREAGVAALAARIAAALGPGTRFYAAGSGWLPAVGAAQEWHVVASANWLATAHMVGLHVPDAIVLDIGSTTTDLIPVLAGRPCPEGRTDAQRLAAGELVYQGVVRTPLCALARRIRFGGQRYNVMNELFATTADVFRMTGELDSRHDQYPSADGAEKNFDATCRRLARMIGHDARDASGGQWRTFARTWRGLMVSEIIRNLDRLTERARISPAVPIVGAGCGLFLARSIAGIAGRPLHPFNALVECKPECADWVDVCAASVAVAVLLERTTPAS